jgi:DNA-binding NtrC family response regulator
MAAEASPLRALIADDDDSVSEDLMSTLESLGYQTIHSALTHAEAVAVIDSEPLDIAFIDIDLDDQGGGIDLAKRAASRGVYVILIPNDSGLPRGREECQRPGSAKNLEAVLRAIAGRMS